MIPPRKAINSAIDFLTDVYSDEVKSQNIQNLKVEEIELDPSEDWLITLGYDEMGSRFFGGVAPRRYKQFRVSRANGDIVWMKIREVN